MDAETKYPRNPQLRLTRAYEDLYWPRYEPSEEERVQNAELVLGLAFWTSLIGVTLDCFHIRCLAPLVGLLVAANGYLLLRENALEEAAPGIVRRPPLMGPMSSAVSVAALPPILILLSPNLHDTIFSFLIALLWLCHFATVVAKHFVWYLTADSLLPAKLQSAWRQDFLRSSPRFFRRQLLPFRRGVVGGIISGAAVLLLIVLCPGVEQFIDAWLFLIATLISYGLVAAVRQQRGRANLSLTWFAVQTYVNSPPPVGEDHPTWSSQGGDQPTQWRRIHFVATVVLLTGLLTPISAELVLSVWAGQFHPPLGSHQPSLSSVVMQLVEQPAVNCPALLAVVVLNSILSGGFLLLGVHILCGTTLHAIQQAHSQE